MRGFLISTGAFLFTCGAALGQAQAPVPAGNGETTFEVASVRPSPHSSSGDQSIIGGPGTTNPGKITYTGCSLQILVMNAFGVPPNRLDRLSGPAWLRTEAFDVVAKVPAGTPPDQVPLMLRNLLIERFKMAVHHDPKEAEGYALVLAKNGPAAKLKEPAGAETGKDGFRKSPPAFNRSIP